MEGVLLLFVLPVTIVIGMFLLSVYRDYRRYAGKTAVKKVSSIETITTSSVWATIMLRHIGGTFIPGMNTARIVDTTGRVSGMRSLINVRRLLPCLLRQRSSG